MYVDIYCKDMELTDTAKAVVDEKMSQLDHLLQDFPPDSIIAKVNLLRLPMEDEYYNVRAILEVSGHVYYAKANGAPLDSAMVNVASELRPQIEHLRSSLRNEGHWRRLRHRSETVRRTVPVDDDRLPEIDQEIHERTEHPMDMPKGMSTPSRPRRRAA